ncbi:MAG: hypothetical protein M3520_07735, partial [Actinomycetota bacterium]|nr:hypothetical protein [Actinomycetota bacterium]
MSRAVGVLDVVIAGGPTVSVGSAGLPSPGAQAATESTASSMPPNKRLPPAVLVCRAVKTLSPPASTRRGSRAALPARR